jgi:hypothetical protein
MASSEKKAFLADKAYDNDAPIVDSDADTDTDDASPRPSDEHVLDEAEEQERLLVKPSRADVVRDIFAKSDQRDRRRRRRSRRKSETGFDEDGRVVFEMEGGFKDNSSESSVDLARTEPYTRPKRGRMAVIHIVIIALFVLLAYGAWMASRQTTSASHLRTYWNGTHEFKPTTILISLDGFRADFLNRGITPALNAFIASGVSPRWMLPSFPSVTFPNHFTLVTGLYPESHGIVSNQFWDPELQEEFYYTDTS